MRGVAGSSAGRWARRSRAISSSTRSTWRSSKRRPKDVIHHSDHGCQYTSIAFGLRCGEMGVRPSMGSIGDAYDNATCESFFATLECELLDRTRFKNRGVATVRIVPPLDEVEDGETRLDSGQ